MPKTVAQLIAEIDAQLPTNNSGQITASTLRAVLDDVVNNFQVTASQINTTSGTPSNTTVLYGDNTWKNVPGGPGGGGVVTAGSIATTSGTPNNTTALYGDNTWKIPTVDVSHITATGTPSSTTFLAGDNSWKTPSGGGGTVSITGGGLGFNFSTRADAVAASIPSGVTWFRTEGLARPGDFGGGIFAKITTVPAWTTPTNPNIGTSPALIHSADGAYWLLQPDDDGIVRPTQFGADAFREWNDPFDQWPGFEHCKYYLLNFFVTAGAGTMQIPPGWYYLSKPHSVEGGQYAIFGQGACWVTTKVATGDAFQFQYAYGPNQTFGGEGEPYNGFFPTYLGLEMSKDGHVYKCVQAGQPTPWNGTAYPTAPSGTSNGQHDGTAIWDYVRELTDAEKIGKAGGGAISGVNIWCTDWDQHTFTKCSGVVMRSRAVLQYLYITSFPSCGVVIAADGNFLYRGGGNVNNWEMNRVTCYYNGFDGFNIGYSDANAGVATDLDTSANGGCGIRNWCFLDNLFVGIQSAYDGNPSQVHQQFPTQVAYNGRYYNARVAINGFETPANYQSPAPDVSKDWLYVGGDGTWTAGGAWPTWSNTVDYSPSGGFQSFDGNDRSVWLKPYQELGTGLSQFAPNNLILGGALDNSYGGHRWHDGSWTQPLTTQNVAKNPTTGWSGTMTTVLGGPRFNQPYPKPVVYATDYEGKEFVFAGSDWSNPFNTNWGMTISGQDVLVFSGSTTLNQYGTGAAQPYKTLVPRLVIGNNTGTVNEARAVWVDYQAPTDGAHARGEMVFNRDPAVGSPKGWVCTVTGTPGTWVSMGNL